MKHKNRPRSSSLFLMELMLAILFFSITSAVCVQIFVKSHLLSKESEALSHAVNACTNLAETLSVSPNTFAEGDTYFYYDDEFTSCEEYKAYYTLHLKVTKKDSDISAHMTVTDTSGDVIYSLDSAHHIARRTDYEKE